ncbi:MAG: sulfite exporter TauE/SafE family protein [Magnetospirillum sp. WYHS-4]
MGADLAALAPFAVLLLLAGAGAGLIAGLLGVGGGIVVVPVLFHVFGHLGIEPALSMKMAVGTSLATIVVTAWASARAHWERGAVDQEVLRRLGPWVVGGVLAGALLASSLDGSVLAGLFAAVAFVVSLQIAFGNPAWRLGDRLPEGPGGAALGGAIGALSALLGIGGGTFVVPVLTMHGYPVRRAVGTAAAMGFVIGIPGVLGFALAGLEVTGRPPFSLGYVSLAGLAFLAPASMVCAPLGAGLAHRLDIRMLRRVFALFLALTAARMAWSV